MKENFKKLKKIRIIDKVKKISLCGTESVVKPPVLKQE
jgi:hypothetical protein